MKLKTSFFNMALFRKNISNTWMFGLIYLVVLIIYGPVRFLRATGDIYGNSYEELRYTADMKLFAHMSQVPTVDFTIFISIIVPIITFWYLFNRRDNYMVHAFPVTRLTLYITGIISSLTVSILPVLLVAINMSIVASSVGATSLGCIWYWAAIMVVSTLVFTSIAMFSMMITGQFPTAVVFYAIFNFLYLMMDVAFRLTGKYLMYGLSESMHAINFKPWSPYNFIKQNVRVYAYVDMYYSPDDFIYIHTLRGTYYIGIYILAALVIFILAYQFYRYKQLETVLDFISVQYIKPVFSVGMSFFISMVAGAFIAEMVEALKPLTYDGRYAISIISALILGVLIYFITQMLIEKTFRVFSRKKFIHCGVYTAVALATFLGMRLDVFNTEDYVPKASDIQWAGIENEYIMVFKNADDINQVRELHKNFLQDKKELRTIHEKYSDEDTSQLSIRYKLKNGNIIIRTYDVVDTESDSVSAEYVAAAQPILDFLNKPQNIKEHIIGNIWNDCDVVAMEFKRLRYNYDNGTEYTDSEGFPDLTYEERLEKNKRVYSAILEDINEGNLYTQRFGPDDYVDKMAKGRILYNQLTYTVYNDDVAYISEIEEYKDYRLKTSRHEAEILTELSLDCVNTLKALKDEGFYDSDDALITLDDYNNGYFDYYDYVGDDSTYFEDETQASE